MSNNDVLQKFVDVLAFQRDGKFNAVHTLASLVCGVYCAELRQYFAAFFKGYL